MSKILSQYFDQSILTPQVISQLERYVEVLKSWNKKINLIGESTVRDIWTRHILDSLQLVKYIQPGSTIVDVGSGAGFPGMVLAITGLYRKVTLIEKVSKKATFLNYVSSVLELEVEVLNENVIELDLECDYLTARAFASLNDFLELTKNLKWQNIILLKGKNIADEILDYNKNQKHKNIKNDIYYKISNGIDITNSVILEMINIHE